MEGIALAKQRGFERSLKRERQMEGIALAKQRRAYKGRRMSLAPERPAEPVTAPAPVFRKPS